MNSIKKIVYFTTGILMIPFTLGLITSWALKSEDYERYVGFWGSVYILIYILFPVIYRGKVAEKISNKYIMFLVFYLIAAIILLLLI